MSTLSGKKTRIRIHNPAKIYWGVDPFIGKPEWQVALQDWYTYICGYYQMISASRLKGLLTNFTWGVGLSTEP